MSVSESACVWGVYFIALDKELGEKGNRASIHEKRWE